MSRHRFHGDPNRFDVVADFVAARFPDARTAADVAGGQGMLARCLAKRHNIECDVIDPRGWVLRGVSSRTEEYTSTMAGYYDVIVGLHPDEALREVVTSAQTRPVVVVPCCNFWTRDRRLGRDELLGAIADDHRFAAGTVEPVTFTFRGPKNEGLVLVPPT
ncbi:MAG: hypothetical protein V7636_1948 [Actinomycetota bacterium]